MMILTIREFKALSALTHDDPTRFALGLIGFSDRGCVATDGNMAGVIDGGDFDLDGPLKLAYSYNSKIDGDTLKLSRFVGLTSSHYILSERESVYTRGTFPQMSRCIPSKDLYTHSLTLSQSHINPLLGLRCNKVHLFINTVRNRLVWFLDDYHIVFDCPKPSGFWPTEEVIYLGTHDPRYIRQAWDLVQSCGCSNMTFSFRLGHPSRFDADNNKKVYGVIMPVIIHNDKVWEMMQLIK